MPTVTPHTTFAARQCYVVHGKCIIVVTILGPLSRVHSMQIRCRKKLRRVPNKPARPWLQGSSTLKNRTNLLDSDKLPCINEVSKVHHSIRPLSKLHSFPPLPLGGLTRYCTLLWRGNCCVLLMAAVHTRYEIFFIRVCSAIVGLQKCLLSIYSGGQ